MLNRAKLYFVASLVIFITACTTSPSQYYSERGTALYLDNAFKGYQDITMETEEDIFSLDESMKEMVYLKLRGIRDPHLRSRALLVELFGDKEIKIDYQSNANLTATQAYHQRYANCLSLTILSYALATQANLNVHFQQVDIPEYWIQDGDYSMLTGHVNLLIAGAKNYEGNVIYGTDSVEIDFDPFTIKKRFSKRIISKQLVVSMFYNNKGAQHLVDNDLKSAYAYFKAATITSPEFSSAWTNLGLLYRLTDNLDFAEEAYRHAISVNEDDLTAMTNLAVLYSDTGKQSEAKQLFSYLDRVRNSNPYYHFLLGNEALARGDYKESLGHYGKAVSLEPNMHEFYFGKAKAYYLLGNNFMARLNLRKAIKYSDYQDIDQTYAAKLKVLSGS